jgi:hypothetical protein
MSNTNSNIRKALSMLATAQTERLHGWASVYSATATALTLDGVTVAGIAKAMKEEGNVYTGAGLSAASEETLRSYVVAASVTMSLTRSVTMCATVANGDLHKKVATAKASGVPTAKVTAWAKALNVTVAKAADDEAKVKALKAGADTLAKMAAEAKAAKAAKDSGPATGTDETDASDANTPAATTPPTMVELLTAAAGPLGKAAKMLADGYAFTAEDEAAWRMLAGTVGVALKTIDSAPASKTA